MPPTETFPIDPVGSPFQRRFQKADFDIGIDDDDVNQIE